MPVLDQPVFLGTAERTPRFSITPHFVELRRDDLGTSVPFELMHDSEEAWIYAELNRFNDAVLEAVSDRLFRSGQPLPLRGFHGPDGPGTLLRLEKHAYPLILSFPYARKLINALGGMPANFVFPFAVSWGPDDWDPVGTQARKVRLCWRALRGFDEDTGASLLYYHDPNLALPEPG